MKVQIFIEGNRIDLFEDEQINITQKLQDVQDISKVFADYSQTFNVPASKRNNEIFKHYYNADIDNGYDARVRKNGVINIDTLDFKRGKIELTEVIVKNKKPSSYKITFYGDVIKIKDAIGKDKLADLTFLDNFNHDYTLSNVQTALSSGLSFTVDGVTYTNAIKYPLVSYKRRWIWNSDPSDTTSSETLVNIAYDAGRTDGVKYFNLKPAIKLSILLEAIENQYSNDGISFSGGFFDNVIYNSIYVNLNKDEGDLVSGYKLVQDVDLTTPTTFQGQQGFSQIIYTAIVTPDAGFENVPYKVKLSLNGNTLYEDQSFIADSRVCANTANIDQTDLYGELGDEINYKMEVFTKQGFEFSTDNKIVYRFNEFFLVTDVTLNDDDFDNQVIDARIRITNIVPDVEVYEFLTDLFKVFNWTAQPDGEDLRIKDLPTFYSEGQIYDITPYVFTDENKVKKGKIFRDINFKFEESDQVLWEQYEASNDRGYGDYIQTFYQDPEATIPLDGDELDVEVMFECPMFERLTDQNDDSLTDVMYCPYFDDNTKPISGNMFLMFINPITLSNGIGFLDESNNYSEVKTVNMPSRSYFTDTDSFSLVFNAELNEYTYAPQLDNLISRFYLDYITDVMSVKRRLFNYKAILPTYFLNRLKLNDRLIIEDRRYIINSIKSGLVRRMDDLELVNDIYDAPLKTDTLNTSVLTPLLSRVPQEASSISLTYVGGAGYKPTPVDIGFGVDWFNGATNDSIDGVTVFTVSFDDNTTGVERRILLQVADGVNNPKVQVIQTDNSVTVDSDVITVDNNIITVDKNG